MEWHDIENPNDPELDRLAVEYHIHPLHIEDCRNRNQRAKVEETDGYIFTVLKPVVLPQEGDPVVSDLDIFLGRDSVITVQESDPSQLSQILQPIHSKSAGLRADQIFYRICDGVVDSYLPILDTIDDRIDAVEEKVLSRPEPAVLAEIFNTRRALIELRRVLVNTRDVSAHFYRTEHELIAKDLLPFLRDIYDHVARNLDLAETQRDLLAGAMDVYLSSVANQTNQVMKVLTILGTIALPMLVISGFFGMNTKGLPLADSPSGTWAATGLMALSTVLLLIFLKKHRWL